MSETIERLLSVASESLLAAAPVAVIQPNEDSYGTLSEPAGQDLLKMLARKNGFYAFESSLLVRAFSHDACPVGIIQWNTSSLWKSHYKTDLSRFLFFAEDLFGSQFCIKDGAIYSFDPETGEAKAIASSLEGWARWLLDDTKVNTGWPLAHFWQLRHGPLKLGTRLLPRIPFVLGGQFTIENLYALDETEGMRFRASIANQLLDCPDGSKVVLKINRGG